MKKLALGFAFALTAAMATPLSAQDVTCDEIGFDEQAVTAYPMVRQACLDVIEHDGARYAYLVARVRQAGPPSMLVMFKHRDGSWGPATRITPAADAKAYLGGELVNASAVPAGSEIGIYLPEGRWEVAMSDAEDLMITEAEFSAIEFEVTAEELPAEVGMEDAAPAVDASMAEAEAADAVQEATDAVQEADEAYEEEAASDSEWLWILGLAGAFIIVWFLLRRRKARRTG